jgi:hypothetical protein
MEERGGRLRESFEAVSHACELLPSPRNRAQLIYLAVRVGRYDTVRSVGLQSIHEGKAGTLEWLAVTGAAHALADTALAAAGEDTLRTRLRDPRERAAVAGALRFRPELWPGERPAWLREALDPGAP